MAIIISINEIKTLEDVRRFAKALSDNSVCFHPDDDFNNYTNGHTHEPTFTIEEANRLNELMLKSFDVCLEANKCIYVVMCRAGDFGFWSRKDGARN